MYVPRENDAQENGREGAEECPLYGCIQIESTKDVVFACAKTESEQVAFLEALQQAGAAHPESIVEDAEGPGWGSPDVDTGRRGGFSEGEQDQLLDEALASRSQGPGGGGGGGGGGGDDVASPKSVKSMEEQRRGGGGSNVKALGLHSAAGHPTSSGGSSGKTIGSVTWSGPGDWHRYSAAMTESQKNGSKKEAAAPQQPPPARQLSGESLHHVSLPPGASVKKGVVMLPDFTYRKFKAGYFADEDDEDDDLLPPRREALPSHLVNTCEMKG